MLRPFETALVHAWPQADWAEVTCLVALSGGADSVALLRAMLAAKTAAGGSGRICAAHFNHGLRSSADEDERFVEQLCTHFDTPLNIGRAESSLAAQAADGVEAAAREQRYAFLLRAAEHFGARWVVTAHTADDQAETILHRVLRGSGVAGLAGIPRLRPLSEAVVIARPLLDCTRAEVVQYLSDLQQPHQEDESNQDVSFTRNRLRHQLLPLLRDTYNPQIDRSLVRLGSLAAETQQVVDAAVDALYESSVTRAPRGVQIAIAQVDRAPSLVLREMLKRIWSEQQWNTQEMGYDQWRDLEKMLLAHGPKRSLPDQVWGETVDGMFMLTK